MLPSVVNIAAIICYVDHSNSPAQEISSIDHLVLTVWLQAKVACWQLEEVACWHLEEVARWHLEEVTC